jgi:hypothetical protein
MNQTEAQIAQARRKFHKALAPILKVHNDVATNADKKNMTSVAIANAMATELKISKGRRGVAQSTGSHFELAVRDFVESTLATLDHVRSGPWEVLQITSRGKNEISSYAQYSHLEKLQEILKKNPSVAAYLGNDYNISPDVVVLRFPVDDKIINAEANIVDDTIARHSELRRSNSTLPILHVSISTKWTIRSDRAQNTRTEALNLIRNRKGRLPHIIAVTAEPLPSRLSSIATGTGDVDCVYHIALYELVRAVSSLNKKKVSDQLQVMIDGKRLKDISDLPLDLVM